MPLPIVLMSKTSEALEFLCSAGVFCLLFYLFTVAFRLTIVFS